ncbi:MAG: DUF6941 family protein [Planctomycetota bacterium]|jgi:hypothetical protein
MRKRKPLPAVSSVLLADHIIVESNTNKKTLVGLYSNIYSKSVPAKKYLNIFVELSDCAGDYEFHVEICHLETDKVIAKGKLKNVHARDRLAFIEIVAHMPVRFKEFGTYEFRMNYEGAVFASRRFRFLAKHAKTTTPHQARPE